MRRGIRGRAALVSARELLTRGLLGDPGVMERLARSSRLDVAMALWLLQVALTITACVALNRGVEYTYSDFPPWASPLDARVEEDRVLTISHLVSLLVTAPTLLVLMLGRGVLLKFAAEKMGGRMELWPAVTAVSLTLVPHSLRSLTAAVLRAATSPVTIHYDLDAAYSTVEMAKLAQYASSTLDSYYSLPAWMVAAVSIPFLAWEAAILYSALRSGAGLGRRQAAWGTAAMLAVSAWISVRFTVSPWIPRFFVDPFYFRYRPVTMPAG